MKKIILLTLFLIFLMLIIPNSDVNATQEGITTEEILESQQDSLDINSFIEEADKYTKDVYENIDIGELFSSAISGNIDNETIIKSVIKAVRRRIIRCISNFSKYTSYNRNT